MTPGAWRAAAEARLTASGDADARWDADWMLCEALKCGRAALRFKADEPLANGAEDTLNAWLDRRAGGEPLQYILGSTGFMGLTIRCDRRALIPRQDTETLAELALERLRGLRAPRVMDLCCGTGAIGLCVARERPDADVLLTDISPDALSLARENAEALGLSNVRFAAGDLFEAAGGERFDMILTNPPYLDETDMAGLQREVTFEPALALDGGADGLDFYRRIARDAKARLGENGVLLAEIGATQADAVSALFAAVGETKVYRDLCGLDRVVEARSKR